MKVDQAMSVTRELHFEINARKLQRKFVFFKGKSDKTQLNTLLTNLQHVLKTSHS